MDANPDKVVLILARDAIYGVPTLEWALDHFDSAKTEFILVPNQGGQNSAGQNLDDVFMATAQRHYLIKCRERKFRAQTLLTQETSPAYKSIYELYEKHGMRNFVASELAWKKNKYATFFDEASGISCTLWVVDKKKLISVRGYGAIAQAIMDETSRHEQEKRDLLSQIKEAKELPGMNEQKWNNIKESMQKENELLKNQLDSLQSDYNKIQNELDNAVNHAKKLSILAQTSDFTWQELRNATRDFSESSKIGKGGFGCVYKGNLRGTEVAIKTLNSQSTIPLSGFKQEVAILTMVRHPNLVTLLGACYEESALVYEFLPNGSLENYLNHANNTTPLAWQARTCIICEICLALIFLHASKPNMVIHGDLKPDNILLDANFVSKLADFGISRLIEQSDNMNTLCYVTYNPVGTPGYMDPEFINSGELTEKSDVFSFGVVILRLLTGKPARGVVYGVQEAMESETFHTMIDASAGEWPFEQAKELGLLGLRCTEIKRRDRPNLFNEVWPIVERLRANI